MFRIMKKKLLIIFTIFSVINALGANVDQLADSASYYYNEADYENALIFYDSIIASDYSSSELYLNTGNCYYKTGSLANAIYYYEKSLSIDPSNENTIHNLQIANTKIKSKTEELPVAFYKRWFSGLISIMSADAWAIFSVVLFVISLIMGGFYLFSRNLILRKTGFIVGISFLILTVFSVVISINIANKFTNSNYAIVFNEGLVKSSPNEESNNLFELTEGIKVEITDSLNSWYNIKLSDGKQGWIAAENVKRI